jgi:hypothetical protein
MVLGIFLTPPAQSDSLFSRLAVRTTLVTPSGKGETGQELHGYWYYHDAEEGPTLFHLQGLSDGFVVFHSGLDPRSFPELRIGQRALRTENYAGVWGQFRLRGDCLVGLTMTVEKRRPDRPPRCPQFLWWDRSQACFAANGLRNGELAVQGYRHDAPACVQDTNDPEQRNNKLRRFVGASFAPVSQGRYIHLTAVAAPGRYRAVARIAWDYRAVQAVAGRPLAVFIESGGSSQGPRHVHGEWDVVAESSGNKQVTFHVRTDQGLLVHQDRLSVEFPRVPGLN